MVSSWETSFETRTLGACLDDDVNSSFTNSKGWNFGTLLGSFKHPCGCKVRNKWGVRYRQAEATPRNHCGILRDSVLPTLWVMTATRLQARFRHSNASYCTTRRTKLASLCRDSRRARGQSGIFGSCPIRAMMMRREPSFYYLFPPWSVGSQGAY